MVGLRLRREGDDERIAFVVRRAFGGEAEVKLVSELRADSDMLCELVCEQPGAGIVGHVAFSKLAVKSTDRRIKAAALAPLAVLPTFHRRGIGRALVEEGHYRLRESGIELVVVLGDPAYYSRLGFSALLARLLQSPYSGDALQAFELRSGVLGKRAWDVSYPAAFARLS